MTAMLDARRTFSMIYRAFRRTFRNDDFSGVEEGGRPAAEGPPLPDADGKPRSTSPAGSWLPNCGCPTSSGGGRLRRRNTTTRTPTDRRRVQPRRSPDGAPARGDRRRGGRARPAMAPAAGVSGLQDRQHRGREVRQSCRRLPAAARRFSMGWAARSARITRRRWWCRTRTGGWRSWAASIWRWTAGTRPSTAPTTSGPEAAATIDNAGFHDTHCMIEGPAVDDVETNFRQRWNAHPHVAPRAAGRRAGANAGGSARSHSRRPATRADQPDVPPGVPGFPFVGPDHGDPGARLARVNAIRRARRFVYIEDQYLTMVDSFDHATLLASPNPLTFVPTAPDTIAAALRERIVGPDPLQFVAILLPRTLGEDPRFADGVLYEMRKRFITFLTHGLTEEQKRDRLLVCPPPQQRRPVHLRPRQEHGGRRRVGERRVEQHRLPQPDLRHRDQLRRRGRGDRPRRPALRARSAGGAVARAPAAGAGVGRRRARPAPRLRDAAGGGRREPGAAARTSSRTIRPTSATTSPRPGPRRSTTPQIPTTRSCGRISSIPTRAAPMTRCSTTSRCSR